MAHTTEEIYNISIYISWTKPNIITLFEGGRGEVLFNKLQY
jgi:hypothetical protein